MPLVHCLAGVGIPIVLKMYLEFRISPLKMAAYFEMGNLPSVKEIRVLCFSVNHGTFCFP